MSSEAWYRPRKAPISPEEFWVEFSQALSASWRTASTEFQRKYDDAKSWTPHLTQLITKLADNFHCSYQCEYFARIDVCYFDRVGCSDWDEWAVEAAIEMENDQGAWISELCKLLLVNAGLKVLIAYEDDKNARDQILGRFVSIHSSRKYCTTGCGWIFIFGPRFHSRFLGGCDFEAFKFDGGSIVEITNCRRTIG